MSPDLFLLLVVAASFAAYKLASLPYSSVGSTLGQRDPFQDADGGDFDEDAESINHTAVNIDPGFNIDGTAMSGALDTNGNPYGLTQAMYSFDSSEHHGGIDQISFDADPFEHTLSIDCSLMNDDIAMHGDPFGGIDWHSDSFDSCGTSCSSMFD